jgi:hypothetical protein
VIEREREYTVRDGVRVRVNVRTRFWIRDKVRVRVRTTLSIRDKV